MEPQNQNSPPDYNFILNQAAPPTGGPAKNRKKYLLVAFVLIVILMLLAGLVLVASSSKNNKTQNTPSAAIAGANPADQFLDALKSKDYPKAASLIPGDPNIMNSSAQNLQTTFSAIDVEHCKVSELDAKKTSGYSDLTCRSLDNSYGVTIHFQVVSDPEPLIINYNIKVLP